jgi:hypothetical protein
MSRLVAMAVAALLTATIGMSLVRPPAAQAFDLGGTLCQIGGAISGALGKGCDIATHAGRLLNAGRKLLGGHLGQAVSALAGAGTTVRRATTIVGLAAIATSMFDGTRFALHEVAALVSSTTEPQLGADWFGGAYWRMAGVAVLLTVPLLLAAVGQAVVRSDLALLGRTAFGFVPLSGLAVGIAVPLTILLLRGSDEMAAIVSRGVDPGASYDAHFLTMATGVELLVRHSVFLGFAMGLVFCVLTIALWLELIVRQAAVTVIVLMLPLFFAALVWPARRVWATRAIELLVSLILAKFAIVAVLSLGAAALTHSAVAGPAAGLTGVTLILLAALSPWALLRILPLHELAGAAAGSLRPPGGPLLTQGQRAEAADEAVRAVGSSTGDSADPSTPAPASGDGGEAVEQLLGAGPAGGGPGPMGGDGTPGPTGGGDTEGPTGGGGTAGPTGGGGTEGPTGGGGTAGPTGGTAPGPGPEPAPSGHGVELPPRPRPGSDVDPIITQAPDGAWRTIELGAGELLDERPLLEPAPDTDANPEPDEPGR